MAHNAQNVFFRQVRKTFPAFFEDQKVLEVGSLDINGSVRDLFDNCRYLGCDLELGPGVDIAVQGQDLDFSDGFFDTVVSAECFEHNPYWRETFINMKRMLRTGGLFAFTCAGLNRPEHGTARTDAGSSPLTTAAGWDYYRNLEDTDFDEETLSGLNYQFFYNAGSQDLYFVGIKRDDSKAEKYNLVEEVSWNDIDASRF